MNEFLRNIKPVFIGSNGIRAGWRMAMFAIFVVGISRGLSFILHELHVPKIPQGTNGMLLPYVGIDEAIGILILVTAAVIVARIAGGSFASFGLTLRGLRGPNLWVGLVWGFAAISAVMLCMFVLHGFSITGIATNGNALLVSAICWTPAFILVGMSEEFMFRGFFQSTLASGLGKNGFWWAALVLSLGFAAAHVGNKGETTFGLIQIVLFGLVACLMLRQTGSLWLPIGFHASWDWGQSFFYGVRDSGTTTWHPFLSSTVQGPVWLTGGSAGPEGSVLTLLVLIASSALVLRLYPEPALNLPFWPQKALATAESV